MRTKIGEADATPAFSLMDRLERVERVEHLFELLEQASVIYEDHGGDLLAMVGDSDALMAEADAAKDVAVPGRQTAGGDRGRRGGASTVMPSSLP